MVITKDHIIFSEVNQEIITDFIPCVDILSVDDLDGVTMETNESQNLARIASLESVASTLSAFQIRTHRSGYNCGRKYCLQAKSDRQCAELIKLIRRQAAAATVQRWIATKTFFERSQHVVRKFYYSTGFQVASSGLIIATLVMSGIESQVGSAMQTESGSPSQAGEQIDVANTIITLCFVMELAINLYAHWWYKFFASWLNMWDLCVVSLSVASLGPLDTAMPIQNLRLFRVIRTIRVLKIFVRLPELKKIISALTYSIVPMLNAFVIVLIMMALYSIVGVTYFRDESPDDFGKLDLAFVTMFRITAGETWVDGIPRILPDGSLNSIPTLFFLSYIVLVNWILVQVCGENLSTIQVTLGG